MAKNFVSNGMTMDVTLAADVASGYPIIVGNKVVVAAVDGAAGDVITANSCGVWTLPKEAVAIEQGADVYLTADGNVTTTATDNVAAGYVVDAADEADSHANVKIG